MWRRAAKQLISRLIKVVVKLVDSLDWLVSHDVCPQLLQHATTDIVMQVCFQYPVSHTGVLVLGAPLHGIASDGKLGATLRRNGEWDLDPGEKAIPDF